jgi:hypothetical protein
MDVVDEMTELLLLDQVDKMVLQQLAVLLFYSGCQRCGSELSSSCLGGSA